MKLTLPRKCAWVLAAGVLASSLAAPLHAALFNLNPTFDAFVTTGPTGNLVGTNYGAAGALSVAAPGSSRGEFQSVLQFNLAAARSAFDSQFGAGQWAIQSVGLTLTAAAPSNPIFNASQAGQFGVSWMQNDAWSEGTGIPGGTKADGITFRSLTNSFIGAGDEALGTFSFTGATNGTASYTLNLTAGFFADVLAGNNVSLRLFAADSAVSYLFDSENFTGASSRPVLSVTVVPEPATCSLVAIAGVLLGFQRIAGRKPHR
jgi:hypothetical protein